MSYINCTQYILYKNMSNFITTIFDDKNIGYDNQIKLCEEYIMLLSKEQLNALCINYESTENMLSLLMYLVLQNEYEQLINFLLTKRKNDIDINLVESCNGWSALFYAVFNSHKSSENIVKMLIGAGANVNMLSSSKKSILELYEYDIKKFSLNNLQMLVDSKIDINRQDNYGRTILMNWIMYNPDELIIEYVKILTQAGVDVNIQNHDGQTALMLFVKKERYYCLEQTFNIITLLVNAGTDLSLKDTNGKTVFDVSRYEIKQRLIALQSTLTQSVKDPLASTTVENPLAATTTVENPLAATTTVEDSLAATTTVEDPLAATTVEDPLAATTTVEDPLAATTVEVPLAITTIEVLPSIPNEQLNFNEQIKLEQQQLTIEQQQLTEQMNKLAADQQKLNEEIEKFNDERNKFFESIRELNELICKSNI